MNELAWKLEPLPKVLKTLSKEGATLFYVPLLFKILYIYIDCDLFYHHNYSLKISRA